MKRYLTLGLIAAAILLGGCAKESSLPNATGTGTMRALNVIWGSPEVAFLIEERLIGAIAYQDMSIISEYDDLDYTFNFDARLAGDITTTRVASQFLDVEADKDYTFLISGALESPDITIWEADQREWTGTETTFEVRLAHTAASLGSVDIYLADAAVPPTLGSQIATLVFGEISDPVDLEGGAYVLTVTPAGDDTTILFTSSELSPLAQSQYLMSIFDGSANDVAPLVAKLFNLTIGGIGTIPDSRFPPQTRFFHTSMNFGDADIYIDDPLTAPFVSGHVFKDITAFLDMPTGTVPITYTAAGNMGSILLDFDQEVFAGTRTDFYVMTNADGEDIRIADRADRRPIVTQTRVRFLNTATSHDIVVIYAVPTGELIDIDLPLFPGLPLGISPLQVAMPVGDYDFYVTETGGETVLAGPIALSLALGDFVETIIYENVDPAVVDFVIIPPP